VIESLIFSSYPDSHFMIAVWYDWHFMALACGMPLMLTISPPLIT